jgi:hypothetical protein
MRNDYKSRLIITSTVFLLAVVLFSPLFGSRNPASGLRAAAASNFMIYLPLVMRNEPIQIAPTSTPEPTATSTPEPTATSNPEPTATSTPEPTATFTPGPPLPPTFGAGMDYINGWALDQMVSAKISWTRTIGLQWSDIEHDEGTYDWSVLASFETELINADQNGIQEILIVHTTPEWARKFPGSGPSCGPIRQDKLPAFANFMHALVARYSIPPYNVKYWEMWNEPDIDPSLVPSDSPYGCWGDQTDQYYGGRYYGEMLKVAYPQIKAADSEAKVLVGGLVLDCDPRPGAGCEMVKKDPTPSLFLEGILVNNGSPYFDGVSFHTYDYYYWGPDKLGHFGNENWQSKWNTTGPVTIAKTLYIKNLLNQYGVSDKFLIDSESAILCIQADGCIPDSVFEITKAYYVTQAYAAGIAEGLQANIWYSVFGWNNSGLLNGKDLSPYPAYTAFKFVISELRNVAYIRQITEYQGVKGYEFLRADKRIWVLWSLSDSAHQISLPDGLLTAWDALGNSVSLSDASNITVKPLYLEWNP